MAVTDPERPDLMPDWALNIDVPKIELFYLIAAGDHSGFAAALPRAVEGHRNYWSKLKNKDVSRNPDGFLALGPLGLAAIAYERKMPMFIDSDYFPLTLIEDPSPGQVWKGV